MMTKWTRIELKKISSAEELEISPRHKDDTPGSQVTIWVVRIGDDLYIRSINGKTSKWFRDTQELREGHIKAGGVAKDVIFEAETDKEINKQIDAAYRTKYHQYEGEILDTEFTPKARSATLKMIPK
jgi:hypothetical protein